MYTDLAAKKSNHKSSLSTERGKNSKVKRERERAKDEKERVEQQTARHTEIERQSKRKRGAFSQDLHRDHESFARAETRAANEGIPS